MDSNREFAVSETFRDRTGTAPGSGTRSCRLAVAVPARHRGGDGGRRHRGVCGAAVASGPVRGAGRACTCAIRESRGPDPERSVVPRSGDHAVFMATQAGFAGSDAVYGRALQILKRAGHPRTSGARWWWSRRPTSRPSRSVPPRATPPRPRTWPTRSAPPTSRWPASASRGVPETAIAGLQQVIGPAERRARRPQSAGRAGDRSRSGRPRAQGAARGRSDRHVAGRPGRHRCPGRGVRIGGRVVPAGGSACIVVAARTAAVRAGRRGARVGRCRRLGMVGSRAEPPRGGGGRCRGDSRGSAAR